MFLDDSANFRLQKRDQKLVHKIVRRDGGERYDNESHFYRCAVLKLIREEKARLRL